MENGARPPHVALFPSPGMGHLIPFTELAKWLVRRHGFAATFIVSANFSSPAQQAFLDALPAASVATGTLPAVPLDDLPATTAQETVLTLTIQRSLPALRAVLDNLKATTWLVGFLPDVFGTDTLDVAREVGVPSYVFFESNLTNLSVLLHLPTLDETTVGEYRDLPEPVKLPGCVPVHGRDLLEPIQDRKSAAYRWMLHHSRRARLAEGILANSFEALEPEVANVLATTEPGSPPVYPVGPMVQTVGTGDGSGCLSWLDQQPSGSVLFVSFGSGGTLSWAQLKELALGLELSGQRFLWVVKSPSDKTSAAFFSVESLEDPFAFLPEGFVERTRGTGYLVPSWAPQAKVLSHEATGGFLSHCGWNSTLESVVNGVPLIAWPLYAEQRTNAVILAEGVRIALRPEEGPDGVVRREEVARVVKELMEVEGPGKAARRKVKELKAAGAAALDKGGSSYESLTKLVNKWKGSDAM